MPARVFGFVVGALLLLLGVVGFIVTGFERWLAADTGVYVLWFQLNPLHNGLHVLLGAALLWGATDSPAAGRAIVAITGGGYLLLGLAGLWLTGAPDANVLALNTADNVLHLAIGGLALVAAALPTLPPARD